MNHVFYDNFSTTAWQGIRGEPSERTISEHEIQGLFGYHYLPLIALDGFVYIRQSIL